LIEIAAFHEKTTADILSSDNNRPIEPDTRDPEATNRPAHDRLHTFKQLLRFAFAGGLNTLADLLILNSLLWLFPTNSSSTLLTYNSLAYSIGAINSFLLNKYWTFGQKQRTTRAELARFTLITICGIAWSSLILWLASRALHPFLFNTTVWANVSKLNNDHDADWIYTNSPYDNQRKREAFARYGFERGLEVLASTNSEEGCEREFVRLAD